MRKKVRAEIRKDLRNYECKIIEGVLADSGSIKKAFKKLSQNKYLIPSMYDGQGKRVHGRGEIVEVATKFYKELYSKKIKEGDLRR